MAERIRDVLTKLRVSFVLAIIGLLAGVLSPVTGTVGATTVPSFEVIATGLDNPRGLMFTPDGALYVAEAGRGGNGPCSSTPQFGAPLCYGPTGAVTRVWRGQQTRIATGLSSFAHAADGGYAFGPMDIGFDGGGVGYVPVGGCWAPGVDTCAKLVRLDGHGGRKIVADPLAYEIANHPDGTQRGQSDPYDVLVEPGAVILVDAAANDVLRVSPNGSISLLAVFFQRLVPDPSGGPPIEMDSVPTSVVAGPDGALYVGELTGYPFPVGGARIYRLTPGQPPQIYADGFTNIIDLAFDHDGSLLVLEIAKNSLLSTDPTGALIRLKPDGTRQTIASDGLNLPTGLHVGEDGALYLSNCGVCAGTGQVIRIPDPPG
jgi:hypothetical protein